jgi:hypothetical protein
VFENTVLKTIFGPKRNEVMRDWGKLHNEELNNLYSSPKMGRACSTNKGKSRLHIEYYWESQKERQPGRPRRRWVDSIKMDLREI